MQYVILFTYIVLFSYVLLRSLSKPFSYSIRLTLSMFLIIMFSLLLVPLFWDNVPLRKAFAFVVLANFIPIGLYISFILIGLLTHIENIALVKPNKQIPTYCFMPSWFLLPEMQLMQKEKWADLLKNHRDTSDEMDA